MSKQSEIKEGLKSIPIELKLTLDVGETDNKVFLSDTGIDKIMTYLHSKGVVIWHENTLTVESLIETKEVHHTPRDTSE